MTGESVLIYKVRQREATKLETQNMKELTHLAWDPPGHMLSVGTAKGNLLLFDSRINKTMSILGKHTKKITCGAWSPECRLALGGDDKQVTVSLPNGDTMTQLMIKGEPRELQFAPEIPSAGPNSRKAGYGSTPLTPFGPFVHFIRPYIGPLDRSFAHSFAHSFAQSSPHSL